MIRSEFLIGQEPTDTAHACVVLCCVVLCLLLFSSTTTPYCDESCGGFAFGVLPFREGPSGLSCFCQLPVVSRAARPPAASLKSVGLSVHINFGFVYGFIPRHVGPCLARCGLTLICDQVGRHGLCAISFVLTFTCFVSFFLQLLVFILASD